MAPPAVTVVGDVVDLRETLSWFETKPLFGWRVLVPRTKEQAGALSARLRGYGAVPEEVPTISVEPPRNPLQMDKAVRGLVEGRYEWIAFTSVNAVKAVREKFEEYGLDARAFSGLKIAAVGDKTAAAIAAWGLRADLVPVRRAVRRRPARGLAAVRRAARPDQPGLPAARRHRHRDPRRRPDRPRLGGRRRHGLPHRAGRPAAGADPRRDQDRQVRRGRVHLVLDGAQPGRHRRQAAPVDDHRGDRPGHGQDRRGARPAGRRPGARRRPSRCSSTRSPTSAPPAGPSLLEAGQPVTKPSERKPVGAPQGQRRVGDDRSTPASRPDRSGRGGCARTPALRRMVAETSVQPRPAGAAGVRPRGRSPSRSPIASMPGVVQHTRDSLRKAAAEAAELGLGGVMLFGIPEHKDAAGSGALDPDGILNLAITDVRRRGRRRAHR